MDTDPDLDPRLREEISRLRDTQPNRDLWPAIARHLEPHRAERHIVIRWPVALAAGVVIAVTTSVGTFLLLNRANQPVPVAANPAVTPGPDTALTATLAANLAPGDAALARAVDDLENAVRKNLDQLDAEARNAVTRSLNALDAAIAQAAQRQLATPDDPSAAHYLTSTLRKKLQLLRTVSQLTRPS